MFPSAVYLLARTLDVGWIPPSNDKFDANNARAGKRNLKKRVIKWTDEVGEARTLRLRFRPSEEAFRASEHYSELTAVP